MYIITVFLTAFNTYFFGDNTDITALFISKYFLADSTTLICFRIILYLINKKEGECVFTTPIGKRIGAFVIAGAIAGNLCGCGMIPKKVEDNSKIAFEVGTSDIESEDIDNIVENNTPTVTPLGGSDEINEVSKLQELYDLLFINGCDLKDVNRELNNILLVKLANRSVSEQERVVLFNSLSRTVSADVDVIEFYYPLAQYVHLLGCKDIAHSSENNKVCGELNNALTNFNVMSFEEYIANKVFESGSITLRDAYERIKASDYSLEELLIELDAIYNVCSIPTDMDEETWNMMFGRLLTTVCEFENVCFVYYDLALLVHKSVCGYQHSINEFGATECDAMTFRLAFPDVQNT